MYSLVLEEKANEEVFVFFLSWYHPMSWGIQLCETQLEDFECKSLSSIYWLKGIKFKQLHHHLSHLSYEVLITFISLLLWIYPSDTLSFFGLKKVQAGAVSGGRDWWRERGFGEKIRRQNVSLLAKIKLCLPRKNWNTNWIVCHCWRFS